MPGRVCLDGAHGWNVKSCWWLRSSRLLVEYDPTRPLLGVWGVEGPQVWGCGCCRRVVGFSIIGRPPDCMGGVVVGPHWSRVLPVGGCSGLVGVVFCELHSGREHLCGQVFKGARWMPWHQEPKKDVGICDKPRGADNQAVIRGCPNGETRQDECLVTCT